MIVAIEKGATRSYRLALSLPLLALLTVRISDGPGKNTIIITMVTFLSRDVTRSLKRQSLKKGSTL